MGTWGKVWGCPKEAQPSLLGGSQQVPPRWMLLPCLGTTTAPFCSRTKDILVKYPAFLPVKCLLPELPLAPFGIWGWWCVIFWHFFAVCHLGCRCLSPPSSTMVNGGLLQSVSVTPTVDSSSIHFPWCTIISLLLTLTSYPDFSQTPSQSPAHILSLVPLLWVMELTVSSLLFLPSAVSTVDRVGCHRIFQCYLSSFLMWLLNSLTCNVSRTTPKANSIGEGRTWKSRWSAQSQLCPGEGNQLLRVMQFLP